MFCPECGTKNGDDAMFCMECGNSLKEFHDTEPMTERNHESGNSRDYDKSQEKKCNIEESKKEIPYQPSPMWDDLENGGKLPYFNFVRYLLLSIVTLGVYSIYTLYKFTKTVNKLCEGDGTESPNYILVVLLGMITLGIYTYYWIYKQARRMYDIAPKYHCKITDDSTKILLWSTFGSLIITGPFIAWYLMFGNINQLVERYNQGIIDTGFSIESIYKAKSGKVIAIISGFYALGLLMIIVPFIIFILFFSRSPSLDTETDIHIADSRDTDISDTPDDMDEVVEEGEISEDIDEMEYYLDVLRSVYERYGDSSRYTLYDLDKDGIGELLISSGTCTADWKNDVYTVVDESAVYIGYFPANVCLYVAEDNNGIYGVSVRMGGQTVYQVTKKGNQLNSDVISSRDLYPHEEGYSNDNEILWSEVSSLTSWWGDLDTATDYAPELAVDDTYILPSSSSVYLTGDDISGWSPSVWQMIINEIYARHGRKFRNPEIQAYFDNKSWYRGIIEPDAFDEAILSQVEKENIQLLLHYINNGDNTNTQEITSIYMPATGEYHNGSAGTYISIFVTSTGSSGFNFKIYRNDDMGLHLIFKEHTAVFESQDASTAVYRGQQYTVWFDCSQYGTLVLNGFDEAMVWGNEFWNSALLHTS